MLLGALVLAEAGLAPAGSSQRDSGFPPGSPARLPSSSRRSTWKAYRAAILVARTRDHTTRAGGIPGVASIDPAARPSSFASTTEPTIAASTENTTIASAEPTE